MRWNASPLFVLVAGQPLCGLSSLPPAGVGSALAPPAQGAGPDLTGSLWSAWSPARRPKSLAGARFTGSVFSGAPAPGPAAAPSYGLGGAGAFAAPPISVTSIT
jgi:hypothetical protein